MLIANTQKQPLAQHLFATGYLARALLRQVAKNVPPIILNAAYLSGCLHDLGKIDVQFQGWANKSKQLDDEDGQHVEKGKFSFENYPRHNELSLLLYRLLRNPTPHKDVNQGTIRIIEHTLYWHHAKPIRKKDYDKLDCIYKPMIKAMTETGFNDLSKTSTQVASEVNRLASIYCVKADYLAIPAFIESFDQSNNLETDDLPHYKHYREQNDVDKYRANIGENANNALIRSVVITADRLISALSQDELKQLLDSRGLDKLASERLKLNNRLENAIQLSLDTFPSNLRNTRQKETAQKLADIESIAVLQGPAGCGKTKIALEWALNTQAKKIIWVCPRVQVCQGLYRDLTAVEYLPDVRVEINTGEFRTIHQSGIETETDESSAFSGDVVITTIDQITNALLTHTRITTLLDFMNAHVVFDEYHEYINMPAFNLLFAELLECKKQRGVNANTLLVSATPNYLFLDEFLGIDDDQIVRMESFNPSRYQIVFDYFDETQKDPSNPLYASQPEQSFVISNTAITAQYSYLKNGHEENSLLLHAKFKRSDKQRVFADLMNSFGYNGSRNYAVLRSGPVVQASLNITCFNMVSELTHAENWLQRLGRLDRFGTNKDINRYTIAIPQSIQIGKANGQCAAWLTRQNSFNSAKAWWKYLQERLTPTDSLSLAEIYALYEAFYQHDQAKQAVREDLHNALKAGVKLIKAKVLDPVSVPNRNKVKDGQIRIKKNSLRSDNRFVQMAVCVVANGKVANMAETYAYQEMPDDADFGSLTESVDTIQGYGDSRKSALVFMAKKHHNIKDDVKKSYNDAALLNAARSPEFPIYLSYTESDLKKVESSNPDCATYYVVGQKQAIGMMTYQQLNFLKDN